jgi:hypothetical protein
MQVRWDEIARSPAIFEGLCKVLLHRLFTTGVRTPDGRGGDGGRDAWLEHELLGLIIFEFKSFTKLDRPQRRQIEKSLAKAAGHHPKKWILIAPAELSSHALEKWFGGLQKLYDFDLEFYDVNWLNQQMATHKDLARYVLDSNREHVLEILREFNAEQADLVGGVPDLVKRQEALMLKANGLSPFWRVRYLPTESGAIVTVFPKPDAPPQQVNVQLVFPDDDPEALALQRVVENALRYGSAAIVPPANIARIHCASLDALNLPLDQMSMIIPAHRQRAERPMPATLRVRTEHRASKAVHLSFTEFEVGNTGMTLYGQDATGLLRLRILMDHPNAGDGMSTVKTIDLQFEPAEPVSGPLDVDPDAMLRTITALVGMDEPHKVEIKFDGDVLVSEPRPATGQFAAMADLLADLVFVRDELNTPLLVPSDWAPSDILAIRRAARLLRGEQTPLPVDTITQEATPAEASQLVAALTPHGAMLDVELTGEAVTFCGIALPIKPLYMRMSRVTLYNVTTKSRSRSIDGRTAPYWAASRHFPTVHRPEESGGRTLDNSTGVWPDLGSQFALTEIAEV